jgi:four helix bundle protein
MLYHERLDVYHCAIEFLAFAYSIIDTIPRGYGSLADQLKRASISIPLNIAEGAGKTTVADQSRFYAHARGSAMECSAILDVLRVINTVAEQRLNTGKNLLIRIVSMLSKMCL